MYLSNKRLRHKIITPRAVRRFHQILSSYGIPLKTYHYIVHTAHMPDEALSVECFDYGYDWRQFSGLMNHDPVLRYKGIIHRRRIRQHRYIMSHHKKLLTKWRQYHKQHRQKERNYSKQWYKSHRHHKKVYWQTHRDQMRFYDRKYMRLHHSKHERYWQHYYKLLSTPKGRKRIQRQKERWHEFLQHRQDIATQLTQSFLNGKENQQ